DEFTKALNEIDNLTWQPLSKEMSDLAEYNYNFL
ncbi:polysaccharide pyruvyl transferase family protein, partial [Salmonella enterica]|nr:polysaccharide pyruvyl transferase family protein [Salmonella enterica]